MKFIALVAAAALSFAASAQTGKMVPGAYDIDASHSKVGFEVSHMVVDTVEGRFKTFDGKLTLADKFEKSTIKVDVDMNSIDTANPKREEHLKSPDFFDTTKFPKMTFVSKTIAGTADSFKVAGDLTIKGVTKPVTFEGKFLGSVNDGYGNDRASFTAEAKIKRTDFGLKWNKMIEAGPVVGDEIKILLRVSATKPLAKKK